MQIKSLFIDYFTPFEDIKYSLYLLNNQKKILIPLLSKFIHDKLLFVFPKLNPLSIINTKLNRAN